MKVKYDQEIDVLRIRFSSAEVDESDEEKPGIILDYGSDGNIVSIEILNASERVEANGRPAFVGVCSSLGNLLGHAPPGKRSLRAR
jgi:uncharacterized protein YuzE